MHIYIIDYFQPSAMANEAFSCILLLFFPFHSFITCAHLLTSHSSLKKCISHIDQRQTNKNTNIIKYPPKATIKGFQRSFHCRVTRVRNPDNNVGKIYKRDHGKDSIYETSSYTLYPGSPRRPGRRIKYTFGRNVKEYVKQPLEHALQQWASASSLKFYRVKKICQADIWISFLRGNHGDELPFDGSNGRVALAFGSPDGRVHFDAAQNWSIN